MAYYPLPKEHQAEPLKDWRPGYDYDRTLQWLDENATAGELLAIIEWTRILLGEARRRQVNPSFCYAFCTAKEWYYEQETT